MMDTLLYKQVHEKANERITTRESARTAINEELNSLKENKTFDWTKIETPARLIQRAKSLGLTEDARVIMGDPTNQEAGKRIFEKIIDKNNLLDVNFLIKGARMARAVGRIVLPVAGGNRLGTGFMVSPQIMMTNNHVLSSENEAANARFQFDYFRKEDGTVGPISEFSLRPDRFFITESNLDFTLCAVENTNPNGQDVSQRGWFPLIGPSGKALIGEWVSIIQHPNGDPQKVVVQDNKVVDTFKEDFLHYKADTMGGSSGSPVLNVDWDLVALHHAAVGNNNEGARISSIVNHLTSIFSQESVTQSFSPNTKSLYKELMESKPSANGQATPSPSAIPINNSGNYGQPVVNPDGSITWMLPVTVSLGGPSAIGQPLLPFPVKQPMEVGDAPKVDQQNGGEEDLKLAMQALEAAEKKVYYSEVKDKQAREAYYPNLEGLNDKQLFDKLSELVSRTHT
ncbi:MAG: serine protease, partial [Allomuricauda sp.]